MTTEYQPIRSWEFPEQVATDEDFGADVLRVRECGTHIELSTDDSTFFLTEEQWKALCALQYTIRWTAAEKNEAPF